MTIIFCPCCNMDMKIEQMDLLQENLQLECSFCKLNFTPIANDLLISYSEVASQLDASEQGSNNNKTASEEDEIVSDDYQPLPFELLDGQPSHNKITQQQNSPQFGLDGEPDSPISTADATQGNGDKMDVRKEQLIDQLDDLVDNKILQELKGDPFTEKHSWLTRNAGELACGFLFITLALLLYYQLWFAQIVLWPKDDEIAPFSQKVNQWFDIDPLARKNLGQLKLTSAKIEPHPNRASTMLLKMSLINNANFTQAMPWLELSLKDEYGQVVARRMLPPQQYMHNNQSTTEIRPKVVKKITAEMLSLPSQAKGYELRIIDK